MIPIIRIYLIYQEHLEFLLDVWFKTYFSAVKFDFWFTISISIKFGLSLD